MTEPSTLPDTAATSEEAVTSEGATGSAETSGSDSTPPTAAVDPAGESDTVADPDDAAASGPATYALMSTGTDAPAAADELNRAAVESVQTLDGPARSRRAPGHEQLVAEGDAAGDYLERLLDILDFDGDIDLDVEGERAVVSVIGDSEDIDRLVGERGEVLDALQELTRLAATAETGQRSRLMLDVAGFRARRRVELSALGASTAQNVIETGEAVRLTPMNPFERKIVHDAIAAVDGVGSSSEGEEPRRRVVVSRDA